MNKILDSTLQGLATQYVGKYLSVSDKSFILKNYILNNNALNHPFLQHNRATESHDQLMGLF